MHGFYFTNHIYHSLLFTCTYASLPCSMYIDMCFCVARQFCNGHVHVHVDYIIRCNARYLIDDTHINNYDIMFVVLGCGSLMQRPHC